jgi:hypothetical protein
MLHCQSSRRDETKKQKERENAVTRRQGASMMQDAELAMSGREE